MTIDEIEQINSQFSYVATLELEHGRSYPGWPACWQIDWMILRIKTGALTDVSAQLCSAEPLQPPDPAGCRYRHDLRPSCGAGGRWDGTNACRAERAHGQADKNLIGKRVVQKYKDFRLTVENKIISPSSLSVYRVEQINGPLLRLRSDEVSGWAPAAQVVAVELADPFFTEYVRANPTETHGYSMRGIVRCLTGELDNALGDFNEAIRLDPKVACVYVDRGYVWFAKKEYDKAISDFSEAIRLNPNGARAFFLRGSLLKAQKKYGEAIDDYTQAIRINPARDTVYLSRANAWEHRNEFDKAIADYSEAIRLAPKIVVGYNNRAWLWATCPDPKYRNGEKAVASATMACEITNWNQSFPLDTLAAAYAETGDFDSATKWQTKANALSRDAEEKATGEVRLKLYQERKPYRETEP